MRSNLNLWIGSCLDPVPWPYHHIHRRRVPFFCLRLMDGRLSRLGRRERKALSPPRLMKPWVLGLVAVGWAVLEVLAFIVACPLIFKAFVYSMGRSISHHSHHNHHSTLGHTPAQLVYGRHMIVNLRTVTNWKDISERKQRQVDLDNLRSRNTPSSPAALITRVKINSNSKRKKREHVTQYLPPKQ